MSRMRFSWRRQFLSFMALSVCVSSWAGDASVYQLKGRDDSSSRPSDALPLALPAGVGSATDSAKSPWELSLWHRLVDGFAIPDLSGDHVERNERLYTARPEQFKKMIERGRPYLYYMVNEVERRGMPLEIALLPMIESAFNPYAYSRAHASGLWQIIPSTGRNLGLNQTRDRDERRDVMAATRSALDYLEYLHRLFSDWQLALAAYNWGEGALARSVARTKSRGLDVNYNNISMPSETRNYVPKLQALKNIIRNPGVYGVELPEILDRPYFRSVAIDRSIGVERAAELADISVREFSSLNPSFKQSVIAGDRDNKYRLLIPFDKVDTFKGRLNPVEAPVTPKLDRSTDIVEQPNVLKENMARKEGDFNPSSWASYQLKDQAIQELEGFVPHVGVSVDDSRKPADGVKETRVGAGETVSVPSDVVQPTLKTVFLDDLEGQASDQLSIDWVSHHVLKKETLFSIARQYGVSPDDIRRWNNLGHKTLHAGKVLKIRKAQILTN